MILRVENLSTVLPTSAGPLRAIRDVTFDVGENEIVGLVGESGSGKSVTINSVLGLLRHAGARTTGSARFEAGTDLIALDNRRLRQLRGSRIGFVAQNPFGALHPILPVGRQFEYLIRAHRRMARGRIRERALELLGKVGIRGPERVLDGYAHELSGGMAQRTVIAMALALDPPLIIADEPTTALDLTVQKQILDLIHGLVRNDRRSMLIVTHDLGVVHNYCDRVVVMYRGTVVESGPTRALFANPAHDYTRALIEGQMPRGMP